MGIAIIIILAALEIALAVLTLSKQSEAVQWMRNRTVVRGIEAALLLLIVLLPTTHMKWRFTGALVTLAILLLIAGIRWIVRRNKATGPMKKARVIVSAILTVLLVAPALVPAFLFTNYNGLPTSGAYGVRECSAILIDSSRTDPFESDGSAREVAVHFYSPDADGSYPLAVFSHGAFGYYQSNYSTYAELVSHGYVVAALDHPHHAFFTKDSDGKLITVDMQFFDDAINLETKSKEEQFALFREWMDLRSADMNFVLDTVEAAKAAGTLDTAWHTDDADAILSVLSMTDVERIGLMGHSMGGATAVSLGRTRSDVDAVVVLDGTMLSELVDLRDGQFVYNDVPYPVPILDFGKTSDYSSAVEPDGTPDELHVNPYITAHAAKGQTVLFEHVGHMDFTDLPLFSPFLSKLLGSGDADKAAFLTDVNGRVLAWFDHYLKGN